VLYQRQAAVNGKQGAYYSEKNATPTEASIAGITRGDDGRYVAKVQKAYEIDPNAPYLESTAAPYPDTWSVKGQRVMTKGGAIQRAIGDRALGKPI
jgi:hypothetical protein